MPRPTDKNLQRGSLPGENRGFLRDMSEGAKSARGRAGKAKSPWRNGPMCDSPNAGKSFKRYQEKAK